VSTRLPDLQPTSHVGSPPAPWVGDCFDTSVDESLEDFKVDTQQRYSLINFFNLNFLVTAVSGKTKPEYLPPAGAILGEHSCPRSAMAVHSVAVDRTPNLPIERRTLYH